MSNDKKIYIYTAAYLYEVVGFIFLRRVTFIKILLKQRSESSVQSAEIRWLELNIVNK